MSELTVNTKIVESTIGTLKKINEEMYSEVNSVDSVINALSSVWEAPSRNKIIDEYYSIRNQSFDNRKLIVDDYINFLMENINTNYCLTENANEEMSELFK